MMLSIPRDTTGDFPKGRWRSIKRDGVRIASFSCPKCGDRGGLGHGTNHKIAADGAVTPSVMCDRCDFHDFVKLEGWEP